MDRAYFRFHAELNHFLPKSRRQIKFVHEFEARTSIKDIIEALGVPHPEIDTILVNGEAVDFAYLVQNGDEIEVYPVSVLSQPAKISLQPPPLPTPRFVLDIHLGKLANSLRLLGFDTLYRNDYPDEELAEISSQQQRILLTRDRGLLKRSIVTYGYYVRSTNPQQQIVEVLQRFNLFDAVKPFQRCISCNGVLEPVSKESILELLPLKTRDNYDEFRRCSQCEQVFWKGTHYQRMQEFIDSVLNSEAKNESAKRCP